MNIPSLIGGNDGPSDQIERLITAIEVNTESLRRLDATLNNPPPVTAPAITLPAPAITDQGIHEVTAIITKNTINGREVP